MATSATGSAQITVAADGSVSGSIETTALDRTMAHIHIGAAGTNGPLIVPMSKTADGVWSIAPGAKLSAAQLEP